MKSKANIKKNFPNIKESKKASGNISKLNTNNKFLQIFIFILFALVISIGMIYHELWRDELEIYSRLALTNKVLMEGDISFIFYYSFLKLFMLFNNSEMMFQIAHLIIIVTAIFLFIKFAKISILQKFLFVFSYFIVYDYGIISRYYGFMMLLIFIIVILITKKQPQYLLIVIFVLILANHSIQSTIFAASLSLYILLDTLNKYVKKSLNIDYKFILAVVLFFIGWAAILLSHYFFTFKNASYMGEGQFGSAPWFMNIKSIWNAFLPIPDPKAGVAFWNTNIVNYIWMFPVKYNVSDFITKSNIYTFLISLFIIFIISIKFSNKPIVLITFLFNIVFYLVFLEMLKVYFLRYEGLLFLAFIYSYFLYNNAEEKPAINILKKIAGFFKNKFFTLSGKLFTPMLYIVLIAQFYSALYALSIDLKHKFTLSQDAAKYISANNLDKTHVMVGFIDYATQTIAAHTKTKIFFPQVNHFSYYQEPFNKSRKPILQMNDIISSCTNLTEKQNKKVLLILNFPIMLNNNQSLDSAMISQKSKITLLKSFTGKIIQKDEQFWLYEVTNIII